MRHSTRVNHLEPMLNSRKIVVHAGDALKRSVSLARQRSRGCDQRQYSIALDELLDMTVSLIIYVAKQEDVDTTQQQNRDGSSN